MAMWSWVLVTASFLGTSVTDCCAEAIVIAVKARHDSTNAQARELLTFIRPGMDERYVSLLFRERGYLCAITSWGDPGLHVYTILDCGVSVYCLDDKIIAIRE
jgi:hypothetical protein